MAHILVVDDERTARELARLTLESLGHSVTVAVDAVEAIKLLLVEDFELIVSDIAMPYLDGVEFLQAVVSDSRTSHVPVIFITALADEDTWLRAMRAGASGYLTKPVLGAELKREIERALRRAVPGSVGP
jgi:CheY-like chemotaxis protein